MADGFCYYSLTCLTPSPAIRNNAIKNSTFDDTAIAQEVRKGKSGEPLFFDLTIEALCPCGRSVQAHS
jgi:hypothetical protein